MNGVKRMDKGAKDYLRFLSGDDEGFTEIIKDYKKVFDKIKRCVEKCTSPVKTDNRKNRPPMVE